ncbi:MAG: aldolase [Prevotellaceae bacterium]|jgi:2-keto-3-deoxy-L-rhamnonate aldolase RhmA|nr:aldolase [Prevotellaceae bacterium]
MITFFFITNDPRIAVIAENSGVDRIFIDLEQLGKQERQGGMNTVQSKHTLNDVKNIRKLVNKAQVLVRSNPVYSKSQEEIDNIIANGADIIMLPYFKTVNEVQYFLSRVKNKAKTCLLFETAESVSLVDEILDLEGIDEAYIGLNDLHLSYNMKFMFELLADGTVDYLCEKFKKKNLPFGFGGIARLSQGLLPAEKIIIEHYRLASTRAILSRSFCDTSKIEDMQKIESIFKSGIEDIRRFERSIEEKSGNPDFFKKNREELIQLVKTIANA